MVLCNTLSCVLTNLTCVEINKYGIFLVFDNQQRRREKNMAVTEDTKLDLLQYQVWFTQFPSLPAEERRSISCHAYLFSTE